MCVPEWGEACLRAIKLSQKTKNDSPPSGQERQELGEKRRKRYKEIGRG